MHKQTPKLEWRFSESDAEWAAQQALLLPEVTAADSRRLRLKQYVGIIMTALLFFTSVGGWWRYSTQTKLHADEAELRAAVAQKPPAVVIPDTDALVATINNARRDGEWWRQLRKYSASPAPSQPDTPTVPLDAVVQTMEFVGEQAIADVVMLDQRGAPLFRQTRFYQHVSNGWQLMPPTATLWGEERTLATPYFVYHFRQRDAAVVAAVAPQIDALYITLWRNFGLPIDPMLEKLVIAVHVTQPSGQAAVFDAVHHLSVASPARYLAPVALSDTDLLAQSMALPLLQAVGAQAGADHAIGYSWQPLLDGLALWQLWDMDLPLAAWRKEIVQWFYVALPTTKLEQPVVLPARYTELCASHKLWMWSPLLMHIPLICTEEKLENANLRAWIHSAPPTRLEEPAVAASDEWGAGLRGSHPGQVVALATLIEYAVATYGRDRLPVLVANLGQHQSWNTLLPAVYGVSAAEFEVGWQAYLTAHYGVAK